MVWGYLLLLLRLLFSAAFGWSHDASATLVRAAVTYIKLLHLFSASPLVLVIVGKLHAGLNVPESVYKDALLLDDRFAVRVAGMIDQTSRVGTHVSIDTCLVVEREEEGVMTRHLLFIVPSVRLVVRDSRPRVFDDLLTWPNPPRCEYASPLDFRFANLKEPAAAHTAASGAVLLHPFCVVVSRAARGFDPAPSTPEDRL